MLFKKMTIVFKSIIPVRISIFLLCFIFIGLISMPPVSAQSEKNITDKDISLAIDRELIFDESVNSQLIDVTTNDGIVTLSGMVDNILEKERAVRIAETIKGVRSVINRLAVTAINIPDEQIQQNVQIALINDTATDSWEIDASVKNGIVTLKGKVDSWAEKKLAAQVAKGVKGVRDLKNDIKINYQSDRSDYEIKMDIKNQLKSSIWIDDALVDVNVKNGKVKLSGVVGSAAEKRRVFSKSWVAGVRMVDDSDLDVKWWRRDEMQRDTKYSIVSDDTLQQNISEALALDPRVYSYNIDVDVENAIVTLTGEVEDLRAKRAAEDDAMNTLGVVRVKNYLKVRPEKMFSDKEIINYVEGALKRDPFIERYKINIMSINRKVYLNGRVDSDFEKEHAERITSSQPGVVDIDNNLIVDYIWEPKSDQAIKEDIKDEFFWSLFIDSDDVDLEVDNGHVILGGEVDSRYEMQAAVENAFEGGARTVENNLEAKYDVGPSLPGKYYERPYWLFY